MTLVSEEGFGEILRKSVQNFSDYPIFTLLKTVSPIIRFYLKS